MAAARPSLEDLTRYRDLFLETFPVPPSGLSLGFDLVSLDVEAGTAVVDFRATGAMLNPAGTVQGGYLTAMLDETMGPLIHVMTAGRLMPSSTDLHTQFHRPGAPGRMRATARITRLGQQICTATAELHDEGGRLLATCIQTAILLPFETPAAN